MPTKFEDLADLEPGIKKAIKLAKDLAKAYENAEKQIKSSAQSLQKEIDKSNTVSEKQVAQAEALVKAQKKVTEEKKKNAKATKTLSDSMNKANKERKAAFNSVEGLRKRVKEAKAAFESLENSVESNDKSVQAARQNFVSLNRRLQDTQKSLRESAKTVDIAENTYRDWAKAVNQASNELKNLKDPLGKNNKEAKRLTKIINTNKNKLKEFDASIGNFQRNVGNYGDSLNKLGRNFKNLGQAAGLTIGLFGAFNELKSAINLNIEFEKSLASLSSITGLVGEDLKSLGDESIRLSLKTGESAKDILDSFKLVGSAKPELLKNKEALVEVTDAVLTLSQASGDDLEASTKALTGTLNQFGLSGAEATRVMNALAAGSKEGSAEIPAISDAIDKFGVVAASSNVSVEESVALVEVLAEKNLKGAEAGTKLRNVLGKLSTAKALPKKALDELEKFGVNLDIVTDNTIPFNERLKEFAKISGDATALTKVFGAENQVAGQIILDNVDKFENYTKAVTGTTTAQDQAATNSNTLSTSISKLGAKYDSLILQAQSSTGTFKKAIDFVTENLETIFKVIGSVAGAFIAYKAAVLAAKAANFLFGKETGLVIKVVKGLGKAVTAMKNPMKTVRGGWSKFTGILKNGNIVLGLAAAAFAGLITWIKSFKSETEKAIQAQKDLNIEIDKFNEQQAENTQKLIDDKQREIDAMVAAGKSEKEVLEATAKANEDIQKKIRGDIFTTQRDREKAELAVRRAQGELQSKIEGLGIVFEGKSFEELEENLKSLGIVTVPIVKDLQDMKTLIAESETTVSKFDKELEKQNNLLKDTEIKATEAKTSLGALNEEQKQINKEQARANRLSGLKDIVARLEVRLLLAKKGSKEELEIQKELEDARANLAIASQEKITKAQIALIQTRRDKNKEALGEEFNLDEANKFFDEKALLNEQDLANKVIKEEEFKLRSIQIEIDRQKELLEIAKATGEETLSIKTQIAKLEADKENQIIEESKERRNNALNDEIEGMDVFVRERINALKEELIEGKVLEEDFNKLKLDEEIGFLEEELRLRKKFAEENKDLAESQAESILSTTEKLNDLRLQQAKNTADEIRKANEEALNSDKTNFVFDALEAIQFRKAQLLEQQAEQTDDQSEKEILLAKAQKEREKAEMRLLIIQTARQSIQAGDDFNETISKVGQAVALAKLGEGFHDGGYTGDGGEREIAGPVHGKEFVVDAKKTKELGLRGKKMADFDRVMGANYGIDMDSVNSAMTKRVVKEKETLDPDILAKKIGKEVADKMPTYEWLVDEQARVNQVLKVGNKKKRIIHIRKDNNVI